jgi:hypothetical protein
MSYVLTLPSLWCSGQSSWLQIQKSGFDSRSYQILWEVVGLERSPLSLVSTIEELLERKSSGCGLENREYGRRDPLLWPHGTIYSQKLALTSLTSSGRSVGIVRSRTQSTEFKKCIHSWVEVGWSVKRLADAGRPRGRIISPGGVKNCHFSTSSIPAVGPTPDPIQWVKWALSLRLKRQGRETDHSPQTSGIYTSTPPNVFME